MPKRVSIHGKGADIFFGGESPTRPSPEQIETPDEGGVGGLPAPRPPDSAAIVQEGDPADLRESKNASEQASKHARTQESKNTSGIGDESSVDAAPLTAEVLDAIWPQISLQATITNAFRYTEQELSDLTDAVYEIAKQYKVKLKKQDVARLALNAILWDYRRRGERSLLVEMAKTRKRQGGRGE